MKRLLFPILLLVLSNAQLSAQVCVKFQEMDSLHLSMASLDSVYESAVHTDKNKGVFKGRKEDKFTKAWGTFYSDLMHFLADKDFKWGAPTYCFNKIYFSPEGKIDYWFFNFRANDSIPSEKQEQFRQLIIEFSKTYTIKILAKSNFCQCGSVTFIDMEKRKPAK